MEHELKWECTEIGSDGFREYGLSGDCDLYTAPRFMAEMMRIIGTERPSGLRFDCAALRYLDSTGIGAVIRILQSARQAGCDVRFKSLSGAPKRVLQLSSVIRLIKEDGGESESA